MTGNFCFKGSDDCPIDFPQIKYSHLKRVGGAHVVQTLVDSSVSVFIRLTALHVHTRTHVPVSCWRAVAAFLILILHMYICLTNGNFARRVFPDVC